MFVGEARVHGLPCINAAHGKGKNGAGTQRGRAAAGEVQLNERSLMRISQNFPMMRISENFAPVD